MRNARKNVVKEEEEEEEVVEVEVEVERDHDLTLKSATAAVASATATAFVLVLLIRSLTSSTSFAMSTDTPSRSGCSLGRSISLMRTWPAASSSSPRMMAKGMPASSAALICCRGLGLSLYENSAYRS